MAVVQLTEPSSAQLQLDTYNRNLGGNLSKRVNFSVPAGTSWAVVGCVLADAATPSGVAEVIVPALEDLSGVITSVNGDQFYGQIPATMEVPDNDFVLHVSTSCVSQVGTAGDNFSQLVRSHETLTPPLNKKWCLFILRVPEELDDAKIAALESDMEGVIGISIAEHLIDGTIPLRAASNATLQINAHLRIE